MKHSIGRGGLELLRYGDIVRLGGGGVGGDYFGRLLAAKDNRWAEGLLGAKC